MSADPRSFVPAAWAGAQMVLAAHDNKPLVEWDTGDKVNYPTYMGRRLAMVKP